MKYALDKFLDEFNSDDICLKWLMEFKYPDGIACDNPKCKKHGKVTPHHRIKNRMCFGCDYCGYHVYPMSDTIFKKSTTSLKYLFYAIYLMSRTRCGISAKQLQRELGVTYKTAWRMFQKIRMLLYERPTKKNSVVEVDETNVGGKKKSKHGQGSENKTPVFDIIEISVSSFKPYYCIVI